MKLARLSWTRSMGIVVKEFIQLKRDRLTFGMIVGIPVIQVLLFGYAINSDPRNLPTAVLSRDHSVFSRSLVMALQNSTYFRVVAQVTSEAQAQALLARGDVQFVVNVPDDFGRDLVRGQRPVLLVEADATDPAASGAAIGALGEIARTALARDLQGVLTDLAASEPAVEVRVHRRYNPEIVTAYNIVPGLLGVILTMTMVLMTGLAMTRERERGTFENLLATPALPIEVMTGKIVPYILIGLIQVDAGAAGGALPVRRAHARELAAAVRRAAAVHRRQPLARDHLLVSCPQPAPGHADDLLLLSAVDAAVRLHVPVPGHAGVGAGDRQRAAADPFDGGGARHPAQGQRLDRDLAARVADWRPSCSW